MATACLAVTTSMALPVALPASAHAEPKPSASQVRKKLTKLNEQVEKNYRGDNQAIRNDDKKAYDNLIKRGYISVDYTPAGEAEYQEVAKKARESLVGRVYSRELLDRVMAVAREKS